MQRFDLKITFVNSQHKNTNSKGDFYSKTGLNVRMKDFWNTYLNLTQIWYDECKNINQFLEENRYQCKKE